MVSREWVPIDHSNWYNLHKSQVFIDSFVLFLSYLVLRFVQQFANNSAWNSIGAKFIRQEECDGFCTNITFDTDAYWKCMIRHYARQANHQVSTCRMGAVSDPTAVVDPYLRLDTFLLFEYSILFPALSSVEVWFSQIYF